MHVIVPLAGAGTRLKNKYKESKPFIKIGDLTLLEISLLGLANYEKFVFICQLKDVDRLAELLKDSKIMYKKMYIIKGIDGVTSGQAETVKYGLEYVEMDAPILISNCDTFFSSDFTVPDGVDGALGTFKSSDPGYSYVETVGGLVSRTAEKEVISNRASNGLYYFSSKKLFLEAYEKTDWRILREKYVAPMYNYLIDLDLSVVEVPMRVTMPLGTPEEIDYAITRSEALPFTKHG